MNNENICEDGALLLGYTAGTLATEESTRVDRHLSSCIQCQEMVRENEELIHRYMGNATLYAIAGAGAIVLVYIAVHKHRSRKAVLTCPASEDSADRDASM